MQNSTYFVALKQDLMQKAIFFDRDGVLNKEIGDYVCQIDDFEILPDAVQCIKLVKSLGFKPLSNRTSAFPDVPDVPKVNFK